jgi:hypothetical protein
MALIKPYERHMNSNTPENIQPTAPACLENTPHPIDLIVTEEEFAVFAKRTKPTIIGWRRRGLMPQHFKLGLGYFYLRSDMESFVIPLAKRRGKHAAKLEA